MYKQRSWTARHYWVNQFGIIEHDIFAHIPPQHYIVKWKEGFIRHEKHFDNKKDAKEFFRTVRKTATDFIRKVKWH
jgi:hypothetical protein